MGTTSTTMVALNRRSWLVGGAGISVSALTNACSAPKETSSPRETADALWVDEDLADAEHPERYLSHRRATSGRDAPILFALHGRGEAGRGLAAGAHGFRDDYRIDRTIAALSTASVDAALGGGFLSEARLLAHRRSLEAAPFSGLHLVCPYCPPPLTRTLEEAEVLGEFLVSRALPKVAETEAEGARPSRDRVGIDGVSMGGRYALQIGFRFPEVFGAVGAMQPAISVEESEAFAELAQSAGAKGAQKIRLVSSAGDPFLEAVRALSKALSARGIDHQFIETDGPHNYAWNRGAGNVELLMFHERVLRGLAAPGAG